MDSQKLIPTAEQIEAATVTARARVLTKEQFFEWGKGYGFTEEFLERTFRNFVDQKETGPNQTFGHGISYFVQDSLSTMGGQPAWCIVTAANQASPVAIFNNRELAEEVCGLLNKK